MWNFRKKRQDQEQQRKVERVLDTQERFLALYQQLDTPDSQDDELARVKASLEGRNREFPR